MTDLSRKKKKGVGVHPIIPVTPDETQGDLVFMTSHKQSPGLVNLNIYATGVTQQEIEQNKQRWKRKGIEPFKGHPQLITELAPHFRRLYGASPASSVRTLSTHLAWWWRLLDRCRDTAPVRSVEDLNDIHYATYRLSPCPSGNAALFFRLVALAREERGLSPLYWTALRIPSKDSELVKLDDVKRIYHWLKRPAFATLEKYQSDPSALPTKHEVVALFTMFLLNTGWNPQVAIDVDISICSEDGVPSCIIPHPQTNTHSIILSHKARARNSLQSAFSNNKRKLSPHNILLVLLKQTAPLRDRIRENITILRQLAREQQITATENHKLTKQIAENQALLRSPWIYRLRTYFSSAYNSANEKNAIWDISRISNATNVKYNASGTGQHAIPILRFAAKDINRHLAPGTKDVAEDISLSDLRDAFISWRYQRSGYSWLDAMLAAGHGNIESLRAYLNKKQHKAFSQHEFVRVGEQLWTTITEVPVLDMRGALPTVIAAKVAGVSDDQIQRWREGKDRTYVGMGCADIANPPKHISPNHKKGSLCRIQRCTLCPENAILFKDSYIHLAKRIAELRYLRAEMPAISWIESDFQEELENTGAALRTYDEAIVAHSIGEWETAIAEGRHRPVTMEGSYA